jgi:hypothetical protein
MTTVRLRRAIDGEYPDWEVELAVRYPLALSEMRWPSQPLRTIEASPVARWGIDIMTGWRRLLEQLLRRLEAEIRGQPVEDRDRFRIRQIKEKFGRLTVYLEGDPTPEMKAAIDEAGRESSVTCEVYGEPGVLAERRCYWSVQCGSHENWLSTDRPSV